MHPYLLCNYPARAVLALLATFFNYCNSLLVGFPDSERCSRTVSECNGQPLSQYKALLSSYLLTLLIFETTSRSLSWRLAARVGPRRFGFKFMPLEGNSALSGEVSSAGNRKRGNLFQALLPICCVTKYPCSPNSPFVWRGSYCLPCSVNLRSRKGCRQVASKYYCIPWGEYRKPPLQQMCLSSPCPGGAGMYLCVHTPRVPSLTYTAFPFHRKAPLKHQLASI